MNKVLMSIKPEYIERIFASTKKYEYRKTKTKVNIDKIIIYATSPVKMVVGEVEVINIFVDTPLSIWNKTKDYSGTTKEYFDKYFKNSKYAIAYELGKFIIYDKPKELKELSIDKAPQSFIYIK